MSLFARKAVAGLMVLSLFAFFPGCTIFPPDENANGNQSPDPGGNTNQNENQNDNQNDNEGTTEQPPELPPISSLEMDFTDFSDTTQASAVSKTVGYTHDDTSLYFTRALIQVGVWQTIVTVNLAIPVAAFAESFNHTPVRQDDGSWKWSYDFEIEEDLYTAELFGAITEGGLIQWDMYISLEGEYTDVHWFTGQTDWETGKGSWTINRDPDEVIAYLMVDYVLDATNTDVGEITYTDIEEGAQLYGSYIIYQAKEDTEEYNRAYTIYLDYDSNRTNIEWDSQTLAGRAKEPNYYGDDQWRCWNDSLIDIDCPEEEEPAGP